jgi:protein-ribulosamine 3-kinase
VDLWADIAASITSATGRALEIKRRTVVGGGCINTAYRIDAGADSYFVKVNSADKLDMFTAEAEGLEAIARSGSVRVPRPVCHGANGENSWLIMEHIELGRDAGGGMRALGRNLARMHRTTGSKFGWHRDNTIGSTPQINTQGSDWVEFWRTHRLGYQLALARKNGYRGGLQRSGEKLMEKLSVFFASHRPPPSLLHGDLWAGNAGFDAKGEPVILDPAVYYGDREADLAMTELFGGFSADFYAAYREASPLDAGYAARQTLYNLYHVLNHLNLFGRGYLGQAERMIARLLAEA